MVEINRFQFIKSKKINLKLQVTWILTNSYDKVNTIAKSKLADLASTFHETIAHFTL